MTLPLSGMCPHHIMILVEMMVFVHWLIGSINILSHQQHDEYLHKLDIAH